MASDLLGDAEPLRGPASIERVTRRRGPTPGTVLAVASLGMVIAFVDATIVNIAFPNIERSFPGTSISTLSWVLNAYNIVFAAFLVAAGRIADLLGRRRMFVFGVELFSVASLLCALAPSPGALIAFRVLQALGAALLVPASLALVLNAFPPERRAHGVALWSAVGAGAAGLGPSLGGVLVSIDDWRLVFLVNIPIGIAAVVLSRRKLIESRTPGRRRMPDLAGAALFALSIAALVLAVVEGQDWGWLSARIIISFLAAAGFGALFVWRCTWHRSPIFDLSLFRVRTFSVANSLTAIGAAGFYGYTLTNVLFLTGVWRYSVLQAGFAMTVGPVVAVIVAGPSSRLALRLGHRPVLVAGALLWGAAVMWFAERTTVTPDFLGVWLPGMVLLGIGAGATFPNLSGAAVASAPGNSFATATGINSVARQLGAALGVALVVAILGVPSPLQVLTAFHDAWTFGAVCMFTVGLGCLLVGRVDVAAAPSLGAAARVVLQGSAADRPATAAPPRARRAITLAATAPAAVAQSAGDFLGAVPLFADLEPALREALAGQARELEIAAGAWLFHEGEPGDVLYVVRAGRLEVVDERTGAVLRELGRGDALGELALLTETPRSASVRAPRASTLLAVSRSDFERLLVQAPALSRALNRVLAAQLRDTRAPVSTTRPRAATVALVPLDDRVPADQLAQSLLAALRLHTSAELLHRERVSAPVAGSDPSSVYAPMLDRAEAEHDLVILQASSVAGADPWTEFCIQQADRILALTSGGGVPDWLRTRPDLRGCDLVTHDVAAGSGHLTGFAEVLDPIEAHAIHPESLDVDIARIARRLTGHSVGLVLSGGGARAFAHIGVIEELLAAGITIDRVAGVSMGAVIGGMFATGLDAEEIDAICFDEWVQRRPLSDYTVPRHALIRGDRFRAMLQRTFGEIQIEELPRSFVCAYTELRAGKLVVARHGSLSEKVGYSICLPVIAPPQVNGREIYIDGSLTDNLPVSTLAELAEGPVIAVDVKASFDRPVNASVERPVNARPDDPPAPRGAGAPARPGRTPSLGETLTRVLLLGSANTSESGRQADLVIRPQAVGVGLLEFHQLDAAREAGRAAAREALGQAPASIFAETLG